MNACILRDYLGLSKHLVVSPTGEISWSSSPPSDAFIIGDPKSNKNINYLSEVLNQKPLCIFNDAERKSMAVCGIPLPEAKFIHFCESEDFKKKLESFIEKILTVLAGSIHFNYGFRLLKNQEFLHSMHSAQIDVLRFKHIVREIKNKNVLSSFSKDQQGFLQPVSYSCTKTITGRMTVKSGPQILTAPKELRKAFKSRYEGGSIVEIDFVSLEPRLATFLAKNLQHVPSDIYEFFSNTVFDGKIQRKECKLAILSAMYGAGSRTLGSLLPQGFVASEVIKKLREKLNFNKIVESAKEQCEDLGYMLNCYGRPIFPGQSREALIYNYYIQSSAVDAALSGFAWLKKEIDNKNGKTVPVFLIHDAIILDVPHNETRMIEEIINNGLLVDKFGFFPVKINFLSK